MKLLGNPIGLEIEQSTVEKARTFSTVDPTASENPAVIPWSWWNYVSGERFHCIDNTIDTNVWIGTLGSTIP